MAGHRLGALEGGGGGTASTSNASQPPKTGPTPQPTCVARIPGPNQIVVEAAARAFAGEGLDLRPGAQDLAALLAVRLRLPVGRRLQTVGPGPGGGREVVAAGDAEGVGAVPVYDRPDDGVVVDAGVRFPGPFRAYDAAEDDPVAVGA